MKNKKRNQSLLQLGLLFGILIFINILGSNFHTHFDLTGDKRFTLTNATEDFLGTLDDVVFVQVLLDGDFPAQFKRLQKATIELLDDFRNVSGFVEYDLVNPMEGPVKEVNERTEQFRKMGLRHTTLTVAKNASQSQSILYAYALVNYKGRQMPVNLLENETPGVSKDLILNNSISLLEYKFASAFKKLQEVTKPKLLYTEGHGELTAEDTRSLDADLLKTFDISRIDLNKVASMDKLAEEIEILIVAKPLTPFSEEEKFKIDQFVMRGGRVLWLLDKVGINLDSVGRAGGFVPLPLEVGLDNLLYRYGARIQPNLIQDLESMDIELRTGTAGNAGDYELFPWFYHPAIASQSNHPVVKNLNRVLMYFPNRIDTIETRKGNVRKTILLTSSKYSKFVRVPTNVDFNIVKYNPMPDKFNKPFQPVAVLLEGTFPSEYENKISEEMLQQMKRANIEFKTLSDPTRMIVVADGDVAADQYNIFVQSRVPVGMNPNVNLDIHRDQNFVYGNKQFLLNAVDYLYDPNGVIEARSKEIKLRPLDKVKPKEEKTFWQLFNIGIPLLLLGLFGFSYNWLRRRKYGK